MVEASDLLNDKSLGVKRHPIWRHLDAILNICDISTWLLQSLTFSCQENVKMPCKNICHSLKVCALFVPCKI